jgi:hypothetical protein
MTLLSDTAYHSFIGEVEALNTTTIRRLSRSRRHQLLAIALMTIMVPDLLEPTDEIRGLCTFVVRDLHEVRSLILAI